MAYWRDRKNPLIFSSGNPITMPSDTNENIAASIPIPGGAMGPNGWIEVSLLWATAGPTGTKVTRIRMGGTGTDGNSIVAQTLSATVTHKQIEANSRNANSASAQVHPNNAQNDGTNPASTSPNGTGAVNTDVNWTLFINLTKATGSDSAILLSYTVKVYYRP